MPTLGIPYTFQNGQTADGAHVSANFQAVKDIVDPIVTNATHTGDVTGATALTIGAGKVLEAMIGTGAVVAAKLATDAVETAKIKDGAVTLAKLASGIITVEAIYANSDNSETITSDDQVVLTNTFTLSGARNVLIFSKSTLDVGGAHPSSQWKLCDGATVLDYCVLQSQMESIAFLSTVVAIYYGSLASGSHTITSKVTMSPVDYREAVSAKQIIVVLSP
jgi:hypothetical protein